jgi:hypothetical protein
MVGISYNPTVFEELGVPGMSQSDRSKDWKPMRLDYVGQVADLMRGSGGTMADGGSANKKTGH